MAISLSASPSAPCTPPDPKPFSPPGSSPRNSRDTADMADARSWAGRATSGARCASLTVPKL
eukprot:6186688-Pleurochrysis_carterae.AAC.2